MSSILIHEFPGQGTKVRAREVPAIHGWMWIRHGLELFRRAQGTWILTSALWFTFLAITVAFTWPIGPLVITFFFPVALAIWIRGCQDVDKLGALKIGQAIASVRGSIGQLLTLGALITVAQLILTKIAVMIVPPDPALMALATKYPNITPEEIQSLVPSLRKVLLVQIIALVPIILATWFAPLLIASHTMKVWHAIRWSLYACIANIGALSVYGILWIVMLMVTRMLPPLLALPVGFMLTPIFFISIYKSYSDIFVEEPEGP